MTNFYIDVEDGLPYDGGAGNDGSIGNPWRTFYDIDDYQSTTGFSPGDTVYLMDDQEWFEILTIPTSGTSGNLITIGHYGSGTNKPIINAADQVSGFINKGSELVTNGSFEGSWTGTPPTPSGFTIEPRTGGCEVVEETIIKYLGSKCCEFAMLAGQAGIHQNNLTYTTNTKYNLGFHSLHESGSAILLVEVLRNNGGTWEYYQWDSGHTWDDATPAYQTHTPNRPYWTPVEYEFQTDATSCSALKIHLIGFNASGTATFYVDALTCGEVDISAENLMPDYRFQDWISGVLNTKNYTTVENGTATVTALEDEIDGQKCVCLTLDGSNSEVGVESVAITLTKNTEYMLLVRHREDEESGKTATEIGVQIERVGTSTYWNGSSWSTQADCINEHYADIHTTSKEVFTTPDEDANQTYKVTIHRKASVGAQYQRILFDMAALQEKTSDGVYEALFLSSDGDPQQVYVTGVLNNEMATDFQLHEEDDATAISELHPFPYHWYYDAANDKLYINVGHDLTNLTVYASVRENNIDFNEKSYVTIDNLTCKKAYGIGIDLDYITSGGTRQTDLSVTNCRVEHAGTLGISAGHRPTDPNGVDEPAPSNEDLTPANITITDNEIYKYNRAGQIRIPVTGVSPSLQWYNGYIVPNCGIRVFPGEDADNADGDDIGTVDTSRNKIESDNKLLNLSCGLNGISICLGNDVTADDNLVVGAMHAIVLIGYMAKGAGGDALGDIRAYTIKRNHLHHTGDDGIWLYGLITEGNHVCYNIIHDNPDNGIDINTSSFVACYNNIIYNVKNEEIVVWGSATSGGFFFNNIFHSWGETYRSTGANKELGCAIEFITPATPAYSVVDYNYYYHSNSSASTAGYPVSIDSTPITWAAWQSTYEQDLHSVFGTDPKLIDPANGDMRLRHDSPCIDVGKDLSDNYVASESGSSYFFPCASVEEDLIDPDSAFPLGVQTVSQATLGNADSWDIGPFAYITQKHLIFFRDSGAPKEGLSPTVDVYKTMSGQDSTPAPIVYELGGGAYAFATRVRERMFCRVDSNDGGMSDDERYHEVDCLPSAEYTTLLKEKAPDGQMAEEDTSQDIYTQVQRPFSIKKNTDQDDYMFAMFDSNGAPKTGLTVAAQVSQDGAAFASMTNAVSEVGYGIYKIDIAADDVDCSMGAFRFTDTSGQGGQPVLQIFKTQETS